MAQFELILPKMGESVAEATIIKWLKNEGDFIAIDESVLEIATDKVDSEVPSSFEGILVKKIFKEGDVAQVGSVIALISSEKEVSSAVSEITISSPEPIVKDSVKHIETLTAVSEVEELSKLSETGKFYSPLVRNIAKEEGISLTELESLKGSGKDGRVTKSDILDYLPQRKNGQDKPSQIKVEQSVISSESVLSATAISATTLATTAKIAENKVASIQPAISVSGNDEIIEMDRMRKLIADHMVMSKHTSPHVTSFVEADVTNIVLWREKVKNEFEKKEGEKITYTPIFVEAVTRALKDFPMVNVSVSGTNIIVRKNINIGIAAALPSGNLIVPVIKNADQMNLVGLTKSINDLASRARINKLKPEEIQGGTFTISNVGNFGNVMGTPIINQPQVAILAVGAIRKKPAVIETPQGDTIGIRHMMFLSLSYDHRVVDGMLGGSFLKRIADNLESFDLKRSVY